MSGQATQYADVNYLNWLVGKAAMPALGSIWVALLTAAPAEPITGASITEANYTGYARLATTAANWNAAVAGAPSSITNAVALSFAACSGGSSIITGFCLIDSAAGAGNVRAYGTCSATISGTAVPSFAAGALTATAA